MLVPIALALATIGLLVWAYYKALKPPRPRICGSLDGPPITSTRITLRDGRHLAYKEYGAPKQTAKHKIIVVHGFASCKDQPLPVSGEFIEEFGIYFLHFDRAGYGESDPFPSRSVRSEAFDIQELADKLEIGSKFFVVTISLGGYSGWSCLKYIPHRLSGIALLVPFVNYWWPCLPANLSKKTFRLLPVSDRLTFMIARYCPFLFYWWITQKIFPSFSLLSNNNTLFTEEEKQALKPLPGIKELIIQQGIYESLLRDVMAGFGKWEFDPFDIANPLGHDGSVHIWQGYKDKIIPFAINRYLSENLKWIKYHEVADGGHSFPFDHPKMCETILKALLLAPQVTE